MPGKHSTAELRPQPWNIQLGSWFWPFTILWGLAIPDEPASILRQCLAPVSSYMHSLIIYFFHVVSFFIPLRWEPPGPWSSVPNSRVLPCIHKLPSLTCWFSGGLRSPLAQAGLEFAM